MHLVENAVRGYLEARSVLRVLREKVKQASATAALYYPTGVGVALALESLCLLPSDVLNTTPPCLNLV